MALARTSIIGGIVALAILAPSAQAQENVARVGRARQSSGYNGDQFPAQNAIDGNYGNFQHTSSDDDASWWEVDLGDFFDISFIAIWNRGGGCCQSRLRDLYVSILDFSGDGETPAFRSQLLNPENVMAGGTAQGPKFIVLDLAKLTGGTVAGTVVRVERVPDKDLSGTGGVGNLDEDNVLQMGEVEVFIGECDPATGTCSDLTVSGPADGLPGIYQFTAAGIADPTAYFFFEATDGKEKLLAGPQEDPNASLPLTPGTWTVTVKVGNNILCPTEEPSGQCVIEVVVKDCSLNPPDTTCADLAVEPPHGGPHPGLYQLAATANDASGDTVYYEFAAKKGGDPPLATRVSENNTARFTLDVGTWSLTAQVRDNALCPPEGTPESICRQEITVKALSANPNIAPRGKVTQSSENAGYPAQNAVDGLYDNFTHTTANDASATWEDDLEDLFAIDAVKLTNRSDCCASRLRDITISVLDFDGQAVWTSELLNEENALGGGLLEEGPPSLTVSLLDLAGRAVEGRFVRVARTADPDNSGIGFAGSTDDMNVLSLAEVEIFGVPAVLPAGVERSLPGETFTGGVPIPVALKVTVQAPGTAVQVREILPVSTTAEDLNEGGTVKDGAIVWSLADGAGKTLGYSLIVQSSCVGTLAFGVSSFTVEGRKGGVKGPASIARKVTDQPLGAWTAADIGTTGGATQVLTQHAVLLFAPGEGLKGTSDQCRFVHVPRAGDFEVAASIDCLDASSDQAQIGLLVRDTLDPYSALVGLYLNPGSTGVGTLRGVVRRETVPNRSTASVNLTDRNVAALPIHLRIRRAGTRISFERSADGASWAEVGFREVGPGTAQVNFKAETLVGIFASAGGPGLARATLGGVTGEPFEGLPPNVTFRRGDVDANGQIELTDPVNLLGYLFLGQAKPACLDAADTDDNGQAEITDAVVSLSYQFLGGQEPAAPGPLNCGPDADQELPDLGCNQGCN